MPTINKVFSLTITPEQFLDNCSVNELHEIELLLSSNRFQVKMEKKEALLKHGFASAKHASDFYNELGNMGKISRSNE